LYTLLCLAIPAHPELVTREDPAPQDSESGGSLFVIAIGDWGGVPVWPYVTPGQLAVRDAMADKMQASSARRKLVLALGDNFYGSGVTGVDDSRFKSTFEDVYVTDHPELSEENMWRVIAGNHDYHQNVSAQIAYSSRSQPWSFPALYYTWMEDVPHLEPPLGSAFAEAVRASGQGKALTAQFVLIDTVVLSAGTEWGLQGERALAMAEEHWDWLNRTLAESTADYLVVGGHYPVFSVSHHGPTPVLVERLRPLLAEHQVSAYLAGHDHCAQAFTDKGVDYHGVGGAHLLNYGAPNALSVPKDALRFFFGGSVWPANVYKGAFATMTFSPTALMVTHLDSDGTVLYRTTRPPRRRR